MKRRIPGALLVAIACLFGLISLAAAQNELAASLEVMSPGVEVLRANTVNWIEVRVEAIVGVGDTVRTDDNGSARITFFADGVDTEILPNSELRINRFEGDSQSFNLTVELLAGRTQQQLQRLLDASSSYNVVTPAMVLAARGTRFAIRVELGGRSAMLVTEGNVAAEADESDADVSAEFGIRSELEAGLSDVVRASTFDELDAALDGCTGGVQVVDDVSLNVRLSPLLGGARVGTVDPQSISQILGSYAAGSETWYRIAFRGGYGWILATNVTIDEGCPALRQFDGDHTEDAALYEYLGDPIELRDLELESAP